MPSSQAPVAHDDGLTKPWGTIIAFLLPALTLYVGFTAYPAIRTLWNSFHRVLPRREEYIGLANYAELARDDIFWRAVRNTILWACTSPLIEVSVALLLALGALRQGARAHGSSASPGSRPVLMSYVVVGILWLWIYNNDWGPVNVAMRALGLGELDAAVARRSQDGAALAHLRDQLDVGRLQHGGAAGSAAFAAQGGDRGGRARQLRLGRQARVRHPAADPRHAC